MSQTDPQPFDSDQGSRPEKGEPTASATSDRRRAERHPVEGAVTVRIDSCQLQGKANNLSRSGILFFTEGELEVSIEVEQDGETRAFRGHLVRCERVNGERRSWAVEFDG